MASTDIYYQAGDLILDDLGITPTSVNLNLLRAMIQHEDSPDFLAVTNNPAATSLVTTGAITPGCQLPNGEYTYGPAGNIPCYDTLENGSAATAATLQESQYATLVQALSASDVGMFFGAGGRAALSVWASGSPIGDLAYAAEIQSIYSSLPTPPSWALATSPVSSPPTQSPSSPPYYPPTPFVPSPLWGVLGVLGFLGGASAVVTGFRSRR